MPGEGGLTGTLQKQAREALGRAPGVRLSVSSGYGWAMSIQTELLTAMKIFTARLDDAIDTFAKTNAPSNIAGATAYISTQLILLTNLNAALCNAVVDLATDVERIKK